MSERPHWTLDRRIPLALLLTIALQTVGLVGVGSWYLADLDGRVAMVERDLAVNGGRMAITANRMRATEMVGVRLEERVIAQGVTLARIERLVEGLSGRRWGGDVPR